MEPEPENETHAAPAAAKAVEEGFPPSSSSLFSHEIRLAGISASRDCAAPPNDVPVLPFPAELDFATMKETRGRSIVRKDGTVSHKLRPTAAWAGNAL